MKMMIILEYTDAEQIKWLTKIWGQTEEFPEDFAAYPCSDNKIINPAQLAPGCTLLFRVHDAANNCEYQLFEGDDLGDLMKIYSWQEGRGISVTRFPILDDKEWWESARKRYTNNPEHYQEEE